MVVMLDEGDDRRFKIALQVVIFEQDAVLEDLVPALDLAVRLGVIGRTADMIHSMFAEVFGKVIGDITGAVIAQKSWLVQHSDAVAA